MDMNYFFLVFLLAVFASSNNYAQDSCQVSNQTSCSDGKYCIPLSSASGSQQFGEFSQEGECAALKEPGSECFPRGLQSSCNPGYTCLPNTSDPTVGACVDIQRSDLGLSGGASSETYRILDEIKGQLKYKVSSHTQLECKYLPGNYVFGDDEVNNCCGTAKTIPDPASPSQNLSGVYFCDYVNLPEEKVVYSPMFCGFDESGARLQWEGTYSDTRSGKCIQFSPYPPYPSLEDFPPLTLKPGTCEIEYSATDLEDRTGLMSSWNGKAELNDANFTTSHFTIDQFSHWFRSHPERNHYLPGDEPFILAYIWLFKNADNDSKHNLTSYIRDNLANPLYETFQHYVDGYQQAYEMIKFLNDNRECINPTSTFALVQRYKNNEFLIEGLANTILDYQCGDPNTDVNSGNCGAADSRYYFESAFKEAFDKALKERDHCRSPHESCNKPGSNTIESWKDEGRHKFIVESVKHEFNEDLGSYQAPYHNLGFDGLVDPPINMNWAPTELMGDNASQLWDKARSKANNENVKLSDGNNNSFHPVYHWSLILRDDKFNEAFPESNNETISGPTFLHYHKDMNFHTNEAFALASATYPSMVDLEKQYWHGPQMLATIAAHILEYYSVKDHDVVLDNMHFKLSLQRYVIRYRLARLFQFYHARLVAMEQEQECLLAKIRTIAQGLGQNVDDESWDPMAIDLDGAPRCLDLRGGLTFGSDGKISPIHKGGAGPAEATAISANSTNTPSNIDSNTFGGVGINSTGQMGLNTSTGGNKMSLASLKGPISLRGGNASAVSSAIRSNAEKNKKLIQAASKKFIEENKGNAAIQAISEMVNKTTPAKIINKPLTHFNKNGSANSSLASLAATTDMDASKHNSDDESTTVNSNVKTGSRLGSDRMDSTPDKVNLAAKSSNAPSSTGLNKQQESDILKNISPKFTDKKDDDSLWLILNKAYVRSYRKLFDSQ